MVFSSELSVVFVLCSVVNPEQQLVVQLFKAKENR